MGEQRTVLEKKRLGTSARVIKTANKPTHSLTSTSNAKNQQLRAQRTRVSSIAVTVVSRNTEMAPLVETARTNKTARCGVTLRFHAVQRAPQFPQLKLPSPTPMDRRVQTKVPQGLRSVVTRDKYHMVTVRRAQGTVSPTAPCGETLPCPDAPSATLAQCPDGLNYDIIKYHLKRFPNHWWSTEF